METGKTIFYRAMNLSHKGDKFEVEKHTQKVVIRCDQLAKKLIDEERCIDCNLLKDVAWLHDVRKLNKGKKKRHHLPSQVRCAIENVVEEDINDDWLEIISQHKGDFKPAKYPMESAILRLCDKIDHLRQATKKKKEKKRERAFSKAKRKCEDTLKLFKQYGFDKTEMNILRNFFKKYREKYRGNYSCG